MLTESQQSLLLRFAEAVEKSPLALTSARDREVFYKRHIKDALALATTLPKPMTETNQMVIDVGSGNGIPGLVFAVIFPHWSVVLLDADSRKCGFLECFCMSSEISNIRVLCARAEDAGRSKQRGGFSLATARALGPLTTSLELISPFIRVGGFGIVSRGTSLETEARDKQEVVKALGFGLPLDIKYRVDEFTFAALIFPKVLPTPLRFPRGVGRAAKSPL